MLWSPARAVYFQGSCPSESDVGTSLSGPRLDWTVENICYRRYLFPMIEARNGDSAMSKTTNSFSLFRFMLLVFTLLYLQGSVELQGQTTQGNILGTITDESGAFVVGAEVTVNSLDTGFKRETLSNKDGFYDVAHLEPGNYQVSAQLS